VPTLLLSGENDRISSPGMSKAVAERLPDARYDEIAGGTHYCLYENPEWVIDTLEHFFAARQDFRREAESL
jgi:pimeloyl-ACP methyl ester carboxylesterase